MTPSLELALRSVLVEAEATGDLRDRLHEALAHEFEDATAEFQRDPTGRTTLVLVKPDDAAEPVLAITPTYDSRGLMVSARLEVQPREAPHVASSH